MVCGTQDVKGGFNLIKWPDVYVELHLCNTHRNLSVHYFAS